MNTAYLLGIRNVGLSSLQQGQSGRWRLYVFFIRKHSRSELRLCLKIPQVIFRVSTPSDTALGPRFNEGHTSKGHRMCTVKRRKAGSRKGVD